VKTKTTLRAFFLLASCGLVAAGCSSTGNLAREQADFPKDKVDARGLFAENCAKCHGEDGRAKTFRGKLTHAQNFTDSEWKSMTTSDDMVRTIKKGHEHMPAFDKKLSESEIEALAAYVQTFQTAQKE
jgi:cbb3-type cytochrome c oxidase subunit III